MKYLVKTNKKTEEFGTSQMGLFYEVELTDPIRNIENPNGVYIDCYGDLMEIDGWYGKDRLKLWVTRR